MPNLKSIKGREVFSTGKWNGDIYTIADLDLMVDAFHETKDKFKPYIKLGHDPKQTLLQSDGLPSAGWVTNIYRKGKKLLADISDIPDKIYQLVKNKSYPYVSSEVFWDISIEGKQFSRMLAGVALLGADMPAVTCLDDFISLYSVDPEKIRAYTENIERKQYQIEFNNGEEMPEVKELEAKLANEAKKYSKLEEDKKATDAKNLANETELKEYKANAAKLVEDNKGKEIDLFISENKIAPSMKEFVRSLLGDEKKEYTIEKKNYSKPEMLKELLKLHKAADVNLDESSKAGDKKVVDELEKVKAFAKEKGISIREAYVAMDSEPSNDEDEE